MRRMISEPVPVLHITGNNPAMMAVTVIILGRTRSTAPSMLAACTSLKRHRAGTRHGLAPSGAPWPSSAYFRASISRRAITMRWTSLGPS